MLVLVLLAWCPLAVKWVGDPLSWLGGHFLSRLCVLLPASVVVASTVFLEFVWDGFILDGGVLGVSGCGRVWVGWSFAGPSGERGWAALGYVFLVVLPCGRDSLCFVVRCARFVEFWCLLGGVFCGRWGFFWLFRGGLSVWCVRRLRWPSARSLACFGLGYPVVGAGVSAWCGRFWASGFGGCCGSLWAGCFLCVVGRCGGLIRWVFWSGLTVSAGLWGRLTSAGLAGVCAVSGGLLGRCLGSGFGGGCGFVRLVRVFGFSRSPGGLFLPWAGSVCVAGSAGWRCCGSWSAGVVCAFRPLGGGFRSPAGGGFLRVWSAVDGAVGFGFGLAFDGGFARSRASLGFGHGPLWFRSLGRGCCAARVLVPFGARAG